MSKSPLSGLLTAAFGEKTNAAAATLDKMERRTPAPAITLAPAPAESPAALAAAPSHDTSNNTSDNPSDGPSLKTYDAASDGTSDGPTDEASDVSAHSTSHAPSIMSALDTSHVTADAPSQLPSYGTAHDTDDIFDPVRNLNRRQGMVLYYLIHRPGFIAQRQQIKAATGIPLPTIRDNIVCLTSEGFITKPVKYVYKAFQGFTYQINHELCNRFLAERGSEFDGSHTSFRPSFRPSLGTSHETSISPSHNPSLRPSVGMSDGLSDGASDASRTHDYRLLEEEKALKLPSSKTIPLEQDSR